MVASKRDIELYIQTEIKDAELRFPGLQGFIIVDEERVNILLAYGVTRIEFTYDWSLLMNTQVHDKVIKSVIHDVINRHANEVINENALKEV